MKDSSNLHHQYYLQFATPGASNIVLHSIGKDALLNSKDEYLNNISLKKFDRLAGFLFNGSQLVIQPKYIPDGIDGKKLKEAKERYSCSTGVCVFKAVAIELIKELSN